MSKIIALIVLFLSPSVVPACSCLWAPTEAKYADADVIVIAEATAISTQTIADTPSRHAELETVKWTVLRAWKGAYFEGDTFISRTNTECCICGLSVARKGTIMLLYLSGREPFGLSLCAGHQELPSDIKEVLLLDKLHGSSGGT